MIKPSAKPPRTTLGLGVLMTLSLAAASRATAAPMNGDAGNDINTLGQLTIVIRKGRRPVQPDSIATRHTIDRQQLQARGVRTLDQALALVPGLNVREGAQGIPRIDIRGLRTRQIKLLINGVPFNSTYDGQFDPTQIPVDQIARIEVVTGAPSVLYGDGAIAGVINVITRKGAGPVHGSVDAEAGQGNFYSLHSTLSGAHGPWDYFFSAGRQYRRGFRLSSDFQPTPTEDGGLRNNSDWRRTNFYGNIGYQASPDLKLGLTVSHVDGANGIPPSTETSKTDPFAQPAHYDRVDNLTGYAVQLAGTYDPVGPWAGRFWVYHNRLGETDQRYDNANYDSMSDPTIKGTYSFDSTTRISGLHGQISHVWANASRLTFALNSRREDWQQTGVIRDVPITKAGGGGGGGGGSGGGSGGGGAGLYGLRQVDESKTVDVSSAALEYAASPFQHGGLVLGGAYNWQHRDDGTHGAISASAGLFYDVDSALRLRGSISRRVRAPSIAQLYDTAAGNPNLQFETAVNYEVGARYRLNPVTALQATVFQMDVKNFIEKDAVTEHYANFQHFRFRGIELSGDWHPLPALYLSAGYTYLDAVDRSPGSEHHRLQYRPRHKATLQARYDFGHGLEGYASLLYVGDQVYYSRTGPPQDGQLNNYTLVDVKLTQQLAHNRVQLYLGANNLFDRNYETSYGFPQAGRFVYGGVKVLF